MGSIKRVRTLNLIFPQIYCLCCIADKLKYIRRRSDFYIFITEYFDIFVFFKRKLSNLINFFCITEVSRSKKKRSDSIKKLFLYIKVSDTKSYFLITKFIWDITGDKVCFCFEEYSIRPPIVKKKIFLFGAYMCIFFKIIKALYHNSKRFIIASFFELIYFFIITITIQWASYSKTSISWDNVNHC